MKRLVLVGVLFLSGCSLQFQAETQMIKMQTACENLSGVYQWYTRHGRTVAEFRCLVALPAAWGSTNPNRSSLPAE